MNGCGTVASVLSHLFDFFSFLFFTETPVVWSRGSAQRCSTPEKSQVPGPQDVRRRHDGEDSGFHLSVSG